MKTKLGKRLILLLLMASMMCGSLFTGSCKTQVLASNKAVDTVITDFKITSTDQTEINEVYISDTFLIKMKWDASANGPTIHQGDYFDVTLPNNMRFPSDVTATQFELIDEDGVTIAAAVVAPGPGDCGGDIHVTFTAAVENKYNVKGTMYLAAKFNKKAINQNQINTFSIIVNGDVSSIAHDYEVSVNVVGQKPVVNEYVNKWAGKSDLANEAFWHARFNHVKSNLSDVIITDTLVNTNEKFIPESFVLTKVKFDQYANIIEVVETIDITDKLSFSDDFKTFRLELGDITAEDQYTLDYKSTYTPGTTITNKLSLACDVIQKEVKAHYHAAISGGTAGGDLASKIKLIKVDGEDNSITLANAVFTITKPDGSTFELVTGADGTIISDLLEQGTYIVKEKTAPIGYELNDEEFQLTVTSTGGAIKTISDKPIKTNVTVTKQWVGKTGDSATVNLLADGVQIDTVILNQENNWSHTFNNLNKFKNGVEINYTVVEEDMPGYTSEISLDANGGFVITNTNNEKTEVSVLKKWIGKESTDVTINLLANGQIVSSAILNSENNWQYTFTDLDKYKDDKEIVYTINEVQLDGYSSTITGDKQSGFVVTNTNDQLTYVNVEKKWVGKTGESVTVNLLADGTQVDSVVLNSNNNWKHKFENLRVYDKETGKEIVYTVEEVKLTGYTTVINGDASEGFVIINTIIPTIPDTGDSGIPRLFTSLMTGSGLMLILTNIMKKKFEKDDQ